MMMSSRLAGLGRSALRPCALGRVAAVRPRAALGRFPWQQPRTTPRIQPPQQQETPSLRAAPQQQDTQSQLVLTIVGTGVAIVTTGVAIIVIGFMVGKKTRCACCTRLQHACVHGPPPQALADLKAELKDQNEKVSRLAHCADSRAVVQ